jgi:hypothetical protein
MCWVGTSPVALSTTSKQALRGAPKITPKLSSLSQRLDSFFFCSSFSQKLDWNASGTLGTV